MNNWKMWGASVIGPLHKKNNLPNQDFYLCRNYKNGSVIVVSDGLGSKKKSEYGAKAACYAVCSAAKRFIANPCGNIDYLLRYIHASWLLELGSHNISDCGATCLFAIQYQDKILLAQLGDGMICVVSENDMLLSDDKDDSFSNITQCLMENYNFENWKVAQIEASACQAVIICTDGISDDILQEKKLDFARDVYSAYNNIKSSKVHNMVKKWLKNWSVPNHTDDKTIVCLYK